MQRLFAMAMAAAFSVVPAAQAADAPRTPEANGFRQTEIDSHAATLNGPQRLRVLRFTVEPAGSLSAHRHTGPGYMCLLEGELRSGVGGSPHPLKAGECAFDPGGANHAFSNPGQTQASGLTFEVIPPASHASHARSVPGMESVLPPK